ncbi:MAG: hypothetical protein IPI23_13500 [Bacteroidetes bacterium]|nr:hypothetical protein [Bacteroidota bacterium]
MLSSTSLTGYSGLSTYEFGGPGNDEVTAVCQDTREIFSLPALLNRLLTLKSTVSIPP